MAIKMTAQSYNMIAVFLVYYTDCVTFLICTRRIRTLLLLRGTAAAVHRTTAPTPQQSCSTDRQYSSLATAVLAICPDLCLFPSILVRYLVLLLLFFAAELEQRQHPGAGLARYYRVVELAMESKSEEVVEAALGQLHKLIG